MSAAVVYLRMAPVARRPPQPRRRERRASGTPSSVGDERRVLERPSADRMHPIETQYVSYWVDRLGGEATSGVILSIFKL